MPLYIIDTDLEVNDLQEIFDLGNAGVLHEMRTSSNSSEDYGVIRFVMQPFGAEIVHQISDYDTDKFLDRYDKIKEILEA